MPAGAVDDDISLSITDVGSDFVLTSSIGQAVAIFGVNIEPEGTVFNVPITLVFAWDDVNNDGKVDGTNIQEKKLIITKDGVAITDQCQFDTNCNTVLNTFTFMVSSLSEFTLAGPLDTDNDGVPDNYSGQVDLCPTQDATGFDVDNNGCIDSFSGLNDLVAKLVMEEVISEQMQNSLISKINNAESSLERDKICAAIVQLNAFENQTEAQRGKKISDAAVDPVIAFSNSVSAFLQSQLSSGETCN